MKYQIELNKIKDYIDNCAGYDISNKLRTSEIVSFRTLYFKLATENTHWSLQKIGSIVNRDHSTVLHSKKLFDELMNNNYFRNLEEVYKIEVLGENVNAPYKDIIQYNELKEKYNKLVSHKASLKSTLTTNIELTNNEKKYRMLMNQEQKVYDERAELVLKSFQWKRKDENRKEKFEIINCSAGGLDARGIL